MHDITVADPGRPFLPACPPHEFVCTTGRQHEARNRQGRERREILALYGTKRWLYP